MDYRKNNWGREFPPEYGHQKEASGKELLIGLLQVGAAIGGILFLYWLIGTLLYWQ